MRCLGIIIEIEENRAIAMTNRGSAISIKKSENMYLGQKVMICRKDIIKKSFLISGN